MKRVILFISICTHLFSQAVKAQEISAEIAGFVYDKTTGNPLENVEVYLANTTLGMSTDREGFFLIRNIPQGMHELVVSMIGYEYISKTVWIKYHDRLEFKFQLVPVIYETEPTEVLGTVPRKWLDDLGLFKNLFFGRSDHAAQCEIENEEVLDFIWTSPHFFIAKAQQPLHIINNALGLKIECLLVNFFWDKQHRKWSWSIKPKFSFLESADSSLIEIWKKNRVKVNYGSPYHFLYTLINRQLQVESYNVFFVDNAGVRVYGLEYRFISSEYDSLLRPGIIPEEYKLRFKKYLYVVDKEDRCSWVKLNYPEITVDAYGYPQEINAFEVYGYWAEQGVADLLPKYEEFFNPHR
jgi:hypothetical protein